MVKLVNIDFKYRGIDYDYDTHTNCELYGCDSICRCSKIDNAEVTDVNISAISMSIYDLYFDKSISTKRNDNINSVLFGTGKEIDMYSIDRILRINKIWDSQNWEIQTEGGYYGEEIGDILINQNIAQVIEMQIKNALDIDNLNERINFLLKLEYNYLLPELENCNYQIVDIKKEDIIFGSIGHYRKVENKDLSHYSDISYDGIRGIVISDGPKFKIIDGYHRLFSTKKEIVKVLKVIKP